MIHGLDYNLLEDFLHQIHHMALLQVGQLNQILLKLNVLNSNNVNGSENGSVNEKENVKKREKEEENENVLNVKKKEGK
jgi:hypothetical protein